MARSRAQEKIIDPVRRASTKAFERMTRSCQRRRGGQMYPAIHSPSTCGMLLAHAEGFGWALFSRPCCVSPGNASFVEAFGVST